MIKRLRYWFAPPTFEDEEKTRLASVLSVILWLVIFAMVIFMVLVLVLADEPWTAVAFFGTYTLPSFAALLLLRYGRVRTGIWAFLITLWVGLVVVDLITPPEENSLTSYMTIIVMAGLLLKGRGALQFTVLTILVKLISIPLDQLIGVAEPFIFGETVGTAVTLGLITVLLYIASNSIDNALDRARRNEKALSEKVEELEETSEELAVARDEALAASRAKSEFLANMSHEIRTPLNAVVGMTELMMDTPLNEQQLDFAETVHLSSNTLLRLINDILDFSKIEANRLELEYNSFDLRHCIESAMDMVTTTARDKGLDLAYLVEPDTPGALIGDVTRVRQVLVNLLSNGVKFTESGEVVVTVRAEKLDNGRLTQENRSEEDWYRWQFSIRDSGIGIDQAHQAQLFESFTQLDASTTRQYGGTGLGLTISKRLVEMMNGRIWVESILGEGATFHFTIQAQAASYQPPEYMGQNQPSLRGKRVLIVDDNETNRKIVRLQTQMWGMEVTEAASGAEAMAFIERDDPFDLAILDMSMPQMDGLMLAEEIRRYRDKQSLPLIMFTSVGMRDFDERLTQFTAFLTKPLKAGELFNVLAGVLSSEAQPEKLISTFGTPLNKMMFDAEMGQRHPLSILMAEDNEFNQKMTLLMLERLGYQADVAENGKEVIKLLNQRPYDVVLMDVQMPVMDGLTATRRIRRGYKKGKQPYIIALTADVVENARERCLAVGMNDYVSKPLSVADLVVALQKAGGRQPSAPLREPVPVVETAVSSPTFDPAALERMKQMLGQKGEAMLPTLINDFHKDSEKLLQEIEQGISQADAEKVRRAAHSLKSNSAHFGLLTLSAEARAVEMAAKDGNLEKTAVLLQSTHTAYQEATTLIDGYLKR